MLPNLTYYLNIDLLIFSFLLGSIPTGYLLVLLSGKGDIRKFGSKNIGATNVLRHSGKMLGLMTLLLDITKGFLPLTYYINFINDFYHFSHGDIIMISAATILGHIFSPWLYFKGGKGVATTLGVILAMGVTFGDIEIFFLVLFVWFLIVSLTKYVALGSVISLVFLAFYSFFFLNEYFIFFFFITLLIAYKHKDNFERIRNKTEHKISF